MKRLVFAFAVIAVAACAKKEEAPVADSPAAAAAPVVDSMAPATTDTTHTDTTAKKDTTKK